MPGVTHRHAFDSVFKNEFCFDLPMFSKYPATSISSYFYKMTLNANIIYNFLNFIIRNKFRST